MRGFLPSEGDPVTPSARVVALILALVAGPVAAQGTPAPASAAPKDNKETKEARESREAAEAMERARRQAANPMRVILEASRVRRASGSEAPAPAAAPAEVAVRAAPTPAPAPVAAPAPREVEPAAVISSELAQTRAVTAGAPALDPAALPRPLAAPALAMPAVVEMLPGITRPTLVQRVDPELPARLLADLAPNTVITAELTLRPDGTVSQVNLLTPGPGARALGRFVVSALQQWRFQPLPSERQWRVDLIFNAAD